MGLLIIGRKGKVGLRIFITMICDWAVGVHDSPNPVNQGVA